MMDWGRKYICDLASACKKAKQDPALSNAQQASFSKAHAHAKSFSSLPNAGGIKNVATTIGMVCDACQNAGYQSCSRRDDWQQPCGFMDEFLNKCNFSQ
jgi:transcriptional regulator of nitric oxide reductase